MLVILDDEIIVAVLFNAMDVGSSVSLGQSFFGLLCLQKLIKGKFHAETVAKRSTYR
jgi:hypothetical protein